MPIRVRLRANYESEFGFKYQKGQTGFANISGDTALVALDGYIDEKIQAEHFRAITGEAPNAVPYFSEMPTILLEEIST